MHWKEACIWNIQDRWQVVVVRGGGGSSRLYLTHSILLTYLGQTDQ